MPQRKAFKNCQGVSRYKQCLQALDTRPRPHATWCPVLTSRMTEHAPDACAKLWLNFAGSSGSMSETAIQDVVQELLQGCGDLSEKDDAELLHFLISGLRSSNAAASAAAAQGLIDLISQSEHNRKVIRALPVTAAVAALHFLGPELSSLAQRLSDELDDAVQHFAPMEPVKNKLSFAFARPPLKDIVLKVTLSEAKEAEVLSSHGWRVWPGAQLLAAWLVSEPSFLVGKTVLEVPWLLFEGVTKRSF